MTDAAWLAEYDRVLLDEAEDYWNEALADEDEEEDEEDEEDGEEDAD